MRKCLALAMLLAALVACSPKAAIEKLAGAEGKESAVTLFNQLCATDHTPFIARFHPELVEKSADQLRLAVQYCPTSKGELQLIGYKINKNVSTDGSTSQRSMTLAQQDGARWVVASFILEARDGGPEQVMEWKINASGEKPAELAMLDKMEEAIPTIRIAAIAFLLLVGGLVAWLIVRSRQKAAQAATP